MQKTRFFRWKSLEALVDQFRNPHRDTSLASMHYQEILILRFCESDSGIDLACVYSER